MIWLAGKGHHATDRYIFAHRATRSNRRWEQATPSMSLNFRNSSRMFCLCAICFACSPASTVALEAGACLVDKGMRSWGNTATLMR